MDVALRRGTTVKHISVNTPVISWIRQRINTKTLETQGRLCFLTTLTGSCTRSSVDHLCPLLLENQLAVRVLLRLAKTPFITRHNSACIS